jgi:hypothetical protein
MTEKKKISSLFVRNGVPDGYVVRLVNLEEKHFPNATTINEKPDGSIVIWFDRVYLSSFAKSEYLTY